VVRGTFSPARAWRLAVGPASTRTLGVGSYVTRAIAATSTKAGKPPRTGTCAAARLGSSHQIICKRPHCILEKSGAEAANFGLAYILQYHPSAPAIFFGLFHKRASPCRPRRRAVSWLYMCLPSSRSARSPERVRLHRRPSFAPVLRNTQSLRRWASHASPQNIESPWCGHTDA